MRTSTILREVKRRLPKDADRASAAKSPYICDQVRRVCAEKGINPKGDRIRDMIRTRIEGHFDVRQWLIYKMGVNYADINDINIQEYRQRWLDSMIVEFTAKGD